MQNKLTDYELYLLNERDEKTFWKVFDIYYRHIYYFSLGFIKDRQQAEDISTTTIYSLWLSKAKFEKEENVRFFLYRVAKNNCVNYLKSKHGRRKRLPLFEDLESIEDADLLRAMDEAEVFNALREAVHMLTGMHGKVAEMYYCHDLNNDEIAKKLGISPNDVSQLKSYAVKKLRKLFDIKLIAITAFLLGFARFSGDFSKKSSHIFSFFHQILVFAVDNWNVG